LRRAHVVEQFTLEAANVGDGQAVEIALRAGKHHDDLLLDRHRTVLRLLQQLHEAIPALELGLGDRVELGAEGGERFELTELGEIELQRRDALHRLDLCGATHTRHRIPTSTAGRTPDLNRLSTR
jgi:hypothetical protein